MTDFASSCISRYPHFADFLDPDETNAQAELLRAHGLGALNDKVLNSPPAEALDVVAEHNIAAMLIRRGFTDLQYEPSSMLRPVDFVGVHGGKRYRLEVKRLGPSEHDELHSSVMQTLNTALASNAESVDIEMHLREPFEAKDINALVRNVKDALREPRMEMEYSFAPDGESVAWYTFHEAVAVPHPRVVTLGDIDVREVTGIAASRIRGKVRRAYDKFKICPHDDAVHLVAIEVENTIHLSQVAEALYGREYVTFAPHGYVGSGRFPGGAFSGGLHSRLGGLVVARRAERHRLFTGCTFTLFWNPAGALPVRDVAETLQVERILGPEDFP